MKAVVYHQYGSPDVLGYAEVPDPVPGDREILVRVHANSLNFGDRAALSGTPGVIRLAMGLRRPRNPILGRDVAGTVEAVGARVTRFRVGDDVLGEVSQGGFAELVAAPAAWFVAKPEGVGFADAATLPVAATTALQLVRAGGVKAGDHVLINGASGGVGTFTVQLAKAAGATVTGVCRTRNVDLVRSLGADHVVDYTLTDVTAGDVRYDAIIDLAGGRPVARFRRILTPRGTFVASNGEGGRFLGPLPRLLGTVLRSPFVGQKLRGMAARRDAGDLAHLAGLVAAGTLKPVVERTYPRAEAARAIRDQLADHARGKTVLVA